METTIKLQKDEFYKIGDFTIAFDEKTKSLKVSIEEPRNSILVEPKTNNSILLHSIDYRELKQKQ